jgi:hypothetical protein
MAPARAPSYEANRSLKSDTNQRFRTGFRRRDVVGDTGPASGFDDSERGQQHSDVQGLHRGSAIGMNGELFKLEDLFGAGFAEASGGVRAELPST